MMLRSFLFIPGDSDRKLGKADASNADAIILDLEDSVTDARKSLAREMLADFLSQRPKEQRHSQLWVRINPLEKLEALNDLASIVPHAPDGIVLPKADGPEAVIRLSHYLDALEAISGLPSGATRVLPLATETAVAPFRLGEYAAACLPRLLGLTWGAEDLSAALGASTSLDASGELEFTYRMVRSQTLLAAHAAGVLAIDSVYMDFRDTEGLAFSCRSARAEGFDGRLAIHPAQVDVINECFLPSAEELALARRIVEAFEAQSDTGTVGIDGRMYDIPHLKRARSILARE